MIKKYGNILQFGSRNKERKRKEITRVHRGSKDEDEHVVETRGRIASHRNQWANLCIFRVRRRASSSDSRISQPAPLCWMLLLFRCTVRTNLARPLHLCTALVNYDLGFNMHVPPLKKLYKNRGALHAK
jgi:hypothetical protein